MGYVLFVWSPSGYTLQEREDNPPLVGQKLELDGGRAVVVEKIGASPFPGDARPCVFCA